MGKCEICGREQDKLRSIKGYHLCSKHYAQFYHYGKFLDSSSRTEKDLNEIIIEGDVARIQLYDRQQNVIGEVLIDTEDVNKVKNYKWRLSKGGTDRSKCHEVRTGNASSTYTNSLHRHIMDCPSDLYVDHINGDRFDNRKINLRICSNQENNWNIVKNCTNTSGYKGVNFDKTRNKWVSEIKLKDKKIFIGRYNNIQHAAFTRYYTESLLQKSFMSQESKNLLKELEDCLENSDELKQTVKNKLRNKALI